MIDLEETDTLLAALHAYQLKCQDSFITSSEKNYQIPCQRKISRPEDRRGSTYCGIGFAEEHSSLSRPFLCPACEYKIRMHFEQDRERASARTREGVLEKIQEDLDWIWVTCVDESEREITPTRLLELLRQAGASTQFFSFEEIEER